MGRRSMGVTAKSVRRTSLVDGIIAALKGEQIFRTLDYRRKSEAYLKQYMHQPLLQAVKELHRRLSPKLGEQTLESKARASVLWEGDVNTTIRHVRCLGVQHRPDFVVQIDGLKIAVEVKRGESGSAVREGVGQSLVYAVSEDFDFVVYLFVDTSRDHKVRDSLSRDLEQSFVESLWEHYNVRFEVA